MMTQPGRKSQQVVRNRYPWFLRPGGRVRLRAGTLYASMDRLKADGLVTSDKEEIVDGRLRRYYRITEEGAQELAAEVGRLRANAAVAASRLGLAGGTA